MHGIWRTTGGGGGPVVVVVIAAVVLAGSGAASAIASLLVTIAIIAGSLIGLGVLGGLGVLACRARSDRPRAPIAARVVSPVPPAQRPQLEAPRRPAIGPGREVHLHLNVSPEQLAAILKHYTEEDP